MYIGRQTWNVGPRLVIRANNQNSTSAPLHTHGMMLFKNNGMTSVHQMVLKSLKLRLKQTTAEKNQNNDNSGDHDDNQSEWGGNGTVARMKKKKTPRGKIIECTEKAIGWTF